jgi:hypothetical protein
MRYNDEVGTLCIIAARIIEIAAAVMTVVQVLFGNG